MLIPFLILGRELPVGANLVFARIEGDHKDRPYANIACTAGDHKDRPYANIARTAGDHKDRPYSNSAQVNSESGYTLVEILMAIAIMSIALIPLMEMLPGALLLDARLERETKVAFLAQRKLEEVKSKAIYSFGVGYSESPSAFPAPDSAFKYTVSDDQGAEIKAISVIVWYDEDGDDSVDENEEQITLYTRIAKRD